MGNACLQRTERRTGVCASPIEVLDLTRPDAFEVRPSVDRWMVVHNGEPRAFFVTRTRAVSMARAWAKALRGSFTVRDADGRVLEHRVFGRGTDDGNTDRSSEP